MYDSKCNFNSERTGRNGSSPTENDLKLGNCDVIVSVLVTVGKTIEFYRKNKEEDQVAIVDELE